MLSRLVSITVRTFSLSLIALALVCCSGGSDGDDESSDVNAADAPVQQEIEEEPATETPEESLAGYQEFDLVFECRVLQDFDEYEPKKTEVYRREAEGLKLGIDDLFLPCGAKKFTAKAGFKVEDKTLSFDIKQEGYAHCLCDYTVDEFALVVPDEAAEKLAEFTLKLKHDGKEYGEPAFSRKIGELKVRPSEDSEEQVILSNQPAD